jgi:hypothetical protein
MSDVENEDPAELIIEIRISNRNLQYRSDFSEPETIFWIEAVKDLVLKSAFEKTGLSSSNEDELS